MEEQPKKNKGGRPRKETVEIRIDLAAQQDVWLDQLVQRGRHGPTRKMILERWISDQFDDLCRQDVLHEFPTVHSFGGSVPLAPPLGAPRLPARISNEPGRSIIGSDPDQRARTK
jgi:hypothetical protein